MLDDSRFSGGNERLVLKTRNKLLTDFLKRGYNVIIDDTNLHPKHEKTVVTIVRKLFPKVSVITVDFTEMSLDVCIERDLARKSLPSGYVGKKIILDMYRRYVRKPFNTVIQDENLPKAIIVDIDGTLANCSHRSPYDTEKCLDDKLILPVYQAVLAMSSCVNNIIYLSGREDKYEDLTRKWLEKHKIDFELLYMRAEGDTRPDWIIKKELFYKHIKDKHNILFVIDDRPQVRKMWVKEGIFVFNVYQDLYQAEF